MDVSAVAVHARDELVVWLDGCRHTCSIAERTGMYAICKYVGMVQGQTPVLESRGFDCCVCHPTQDVAVLPIAQALTPRKQSTTTTTSMTTTPDSLTKTSTTGGTPTNTAHGEANTSSSDDRSGTLLCPPLETLDLHHNLLGPGSAQALATALLTNTCLVHLDISFNQV